MIAEAKRIVDLIGVGALNLDYIATQNHLREKDEDKVARFRSEFISGRERLVSSKEFESIKRSFGENAFEVCLGGSAFNTLKAVVATVPRLHLAYVGAAGQDEYGRSPFLKWFATHKVDAKWVIDARPAHAGRCMSIVEGERSLITARGANDHLMDTLEKRSEQLAKYLASSRAIHLTSFFDPRAPKLLATVLADVKRRNPAVI